MRKQLTIRFKGAARLQATAELTEGFGVVATLASGVLRFLYFRGAGAASVLRTGAAGAGPLGAPA